MGWKPIRKVTVGTVVGVLLLVIGHFVPAWRDNMPALVQQGVVLAGAVIAAYLTKLENYLQQ